MDPASRIPAPARGESLRHGGGAAGRLHRDCEASGVASSSNGAA